MSGGSFDYLCYKAPHEILARSYVLDEMRDDCLNHGLMDEAKELDRFAQDMRTYENMIKWRVERMTGILKAVEWAASGDYSYDQVHEAFIEMLKKGVP